MCKRHALGKVATAKSMGCGHCGGAIAIGTAVHIRMMEQNLGLHEGAFKQSLEAMLEYAQGEVGNSHKGYFSEGGWCYDTLNKVRDACGGS